MLYAGARVRAFRVDVCSCNHVPIFPMSHRDRERQRETDRQTHSFTHSLAHTHTHTAQTYSPTRPLQYHAKHSSNPPSAKTSRSAQSVLASGRAEASSKAQPKFFRFREAPSSGSEDGVCFKNEQGIRNILLLGPVAGPGTAMPSSQVQSSDPPPFGAAAVKSLPD